MDNQQMQKKPLMLLFFKRLESQNWGYLFEEFIMFCFHQHGLQEQLCFFLLEIPAECMLMQLPSWIAGIAFWLVSISIISSFQFTLKFHLWTIIFLKHNPFYTVLQWLPTAHRKIMFSLQFQALLTLFQACGNPLSVPTCLISSSFFSFCHRTPSFSPAAASCQINIAYSTDALLQA